MKGTFYEAARKAERRANEGRCWHIFKRRPTINHI